MEPLRFHRSVVYDFSVRSALCLCWRAEAPRFVPLSFRRILYHRSALFKILRRFNFNNSISGRAVLTPGQMLSFVLLAFLSDKVIADPSPPPTPSRTPIITQTQTPTATPIPAGLHWALIFGCTGAAAIVMVLLGALAVYIMNKSAKAEYEPINREFMGEGNG
jgi:hypothetical protein